MKRIKSYYLFCLLFFINYSCSSPICKELISNLEQISCLNEEDCIVDMKNIFTDNWDYIFVFQSFNTPEDISEAIGFKYAGNAIYDHEKLFLFISNNRIQRSSITECNMLNIQNVIKNGYLKIDSKYPKFKLKIKVENGSKNYILLASPMSQE